jgi:hypothetical protein
MLPELLLNPSRLNIMECLQEMVPGTVASRQLRSAALPHLAPHSGCLAGCCTCRCWYAPACTLCAARASRRSWCCGSSSPPCRCGGRGRIIQGSLYNRFCWECFSTRLDIWWRGEPLQQRACNVLRRVGAVGAGLRRLGALAPGCSMCMSPEGSQQAVQAAAPWDAFSALHTGKWQCCKRPPPEVPMRKRPIYLSSVVLHPALTQHMRAHIHARRR